MQYQGVRASGTAHACNCIGPQNGQPLCPCQMSSVHVRDGRFVQERDLGPAEVFPKIDIERIFAQQNARTEIKALRKRLDELERELNAK
jgi:hypothetical protein